MSAANTARGKSTEQMAAKWLREHGFPHCERTVRTGYAVQGREMADGGDLQLCPGVVASVKSLRPANRAERAVPQWMVEAEMQRLQAKAVYCPLIVRREGTADVGEWWWFLPLLRVPGMQRDFANPPGAPRLAWRGAVPVRTTVEDGAALLRAAGYGDPIEGAS